MCHCAGETEEQYLKTEALVCEVGFDRVNTAAYSPRPNTPAAEWDNQVADLIKADRLNRCVYVCVYLCLCVCMCVIVYVCVHVAACVL